MMSFLGVLFVAFIIFSLTPRSEEDSVYQRTLANDSRINEYLESNGTDLFDELYISNDDLNGVGLNLDKQKIFIFEADEDKKIDYRTYDFNDLVESEIVEDGVSTSKTSRASQFKGLVVGGAIAGGVGAVVGGLSGQKVNEERVKKVDLRLIINDLHNPSHTVCFLPESGYEHSAKSKDYQKAMKDVNKIQDYMRLIIERY